MIRAGQINIGPLQWDVLVPDGAAVVYSDPAYRGFWTDSGDAVGAPVKSCLFRLPVTIIRAARSIPREAPIYCGGKNWALWEDGEHLVICSGFHEQAVARFYCRLARDLSAADVWLDPAREGDTPEKFDAPLRYPLDQILTWGMLAQCGGVILHASVAVKDGMGWVFTGRSGAGKSTISGLCHDAGWRILNDDRVIVYPRDGVYRVAGTPWHGSGRFAVADEVPLGGIFFIHQAAAEAITPMLAEEARYALLDVAAIPWFEDGWSQGALQAVEALMHHVPFHHFHFTKTPAAVAALENRLPQFSGVAV